MYVPSPFTICTAARFLIPPGRCVGDMEAPPVGGQRAGGGGPDGSHAVVWGARLRSIKSDKSE